MNDFMFWLMYGFAVVGVSRMIELWLPIVGYAIGKRRRLREQLRLADTINKQLEKSKTHG